MSGDASAVSEVDRVRAEAVGARHDHAKMLEARRLTREAIAEIATQVSPGMAEEDALAMTKRVLREKGLGRGWHGVHVRFGTNTLKNFGEPSDPGIVLGNDDIWFIDIGPVWGHWEADAGETFVVGDDPDMKRIVHDVHAVFDAVRDHWRSKRLSGEALYRLAIEEAERRGWTLNLEMSGHRLSEFPHAAHFKGPLAEARFTPSAGLWMLEIQIRHPDRPFSAFFEDLLLAPEDE